MSKHDNIASDEELAEPLDPHQAQQLIRRALSAGSVTFSKHALAEMKADDLTTVDCTNVLRGGVVEEPEFERGSWRYRARTNRMVFVVAFRSAVEIVVVTAWRIRV
jgi:hypothetical protein